MVYLERSYHWVPRTHGVWVEACVMDDPTEIPFPFQSEECAASQSDQKVTEDGNAFIT